MQCMRLQKGWLQKIVLCKPPCLASSVDDPLIMDMQITLGFTNFTPMKTLMIEDLTLTNIGANKPAN